MGIPKDYRHIDGFGVHAFKWINSKGKERLVKYHWKSSQGEYGHSCVWKTAIFPHLTFVCASPP